MFTGFIMEKICGIYKIISPSKKIYIGKSVDIQDRLRKYKHGKCFTQTLIYRSIKKHGWDKHRFEIIHLCERENLSELEKYYIELYQCFNSKHGLNLMNGEGFNYKHSDETKRKIGDAHRGMSFSKEAILKMSLAASRTKNFTGKKHSEESKQKMRDAKLGKTASKETRLKMSKSQKKRQELRWLKLPYLKPEDRG